MLYVLDILESIEKALKPVRDFIEDNYSNPIMWLGLFVLGLLVFQATYSALQKEK